MVRKITLVDVAQAAGVSRSAAGFILSDRYDIAIPDSTRQRVKQVAAEMNYRTNQTARALSSGQTKTITIVFLGVINSYHARVLETFERYTSNHGYHLIASTIGHASPQNAASDLISLIHGPTDAVVLVDMFKGYQHNLHPVSFDVKPVIAVGIHTIEALDCVEVDLQPASYEACQNLLKRAPRRIVYFGVNGPQFTMPEIAVQAKAGEADPRVIAFCQAVSEAGYVPELVGGDFTTRAATLERLTAYLQDNGCPEAIFCHNDVLAVRVHGALRRMGFRIPDDVCLVGCDGMEVTEDMEPSLSTIAQPVEEMCSQTWQFLETRLTSSVPSRQHACLEARFVPRASSHITSALF